MTDDDLDASAAFSAELHRRLRSGRIVPPAADTAGIPVAEAMNAFAALEQSGAGEAELEAARANVTRLIAEAREPNAPPPDFGSGARPPEPQPLGMNELLRASRDGWAIRGSGV
jgi:hypothetical protein